MYWSKKRSGPALHIDDGTGKPACGAASHGGTDVRPAEGFRTLIGGCKRCASSVPGKMAERAGIEKRLVELDEEIPEATAKPRYDGHLRDLLTWQRMHTERHAILTRQLASSHHAARAAAPQPLSGKAAIRQAEALQWKAWTDRAGRMCIDAGEWEVEGRRHRATIVVDISKILPMVTKAVLRRDRKSKSAGGAIAVKIT